MSPKSLVVLLCFVAAVHGGCPFLGQSLGLRSSDASEPLVRPFEAEETAEDPLFKLNKNFHEAYTHAISETREHVYPVLMVTFSLELWLNSTYSVTGRKMASQLLTPLKKVCHVPLAIYSSLLDVSDRPSIGDFAREKLGEIANGIPLAKQDSLKKFFEKTQYPHMERQHTILDLSLDFATKVLRDGSVSRSDLDAFVGKQGPLVMQNVKDAAIDEVDSVHSQVMEWKNNLLSVEEWERLTVFIPGAHMARKGEMHKQYFERVLEQKDPKIIYGENVWEKADAVDLISKHFVDFHASEAFFQDPYRLHRDILADATTEYLNKKFPRTPSTPADII